MTGMPLIESRKRTNAGNIKESGKERDTQGMMPCLEVLRIPNGMYGGVRREENLSLLFLINILSIIVEINWEFMYYTANKTQRRQL
jgi:hypothetical protein